MNFSRLFVVVIVVTLCGGAFGAAVGGLVGFAGPNSLSVFFGIQKPQVVEDTSQNNRARLDAPPEGHTARFSVSPQRETNLASYGAALGGASGLVLGSMLGILLAVADQLILLFRERRPASLNHVNTSSGRAI